MGEAAWYLGNSTGWIIKRPIELRRGIARHHPVDLHRQAPGNPVGVVLSAHLVGDLLAAPVSNSSPFAVRAPFCVAVPELTRSADIKLNNGVSLQRHPERLVISHRTISP